MEEWQSCHLLLSSARLGNHKSEETDGEKGHFRERRDGSAVSPSLVGHVCGLATYLALRRSPKLLFLPVFLVTGKASRLHVVPTRKQREGCFMYD